MEHIFETDNAEAFSVNLTPGRCNGLACVWARATLIYGGVRYAGMLDYGHVNIAQQAYEQQHQSETAALEAAGLRVEARSELQNWSPLIAAATMATNAGTYFFDVKGNGGHALGYRNANAFVGHVYEYFDPNLGLYRTNDVDDFRTSVQALLGAAFFNDLRTKMRFFRVVKD